MKPFQRQSDALWWATANGVGPCCVRVRIEINTPRRRPVVENWIGIFDGRHFTFYNPRTTTVEVHAAYTIVDEVGEL
jgi:hypothetical protein